jgi:hypothetical protein
LITVGDFDASIPCDNSGLVEFGTPNLFSFAREDVFNNEVATLFSGFQFIGLADDGRHAFFLDRFRELFVFHVL